MNKKILTIISFTFLFIIMLNLTSASMLGVFQENKTINLFQSCSSCSFVNLTDVILPEGNIINYNVIMNKNYSSYIYPFSNTSQLGNYKYNVCGDKGGILTCETINFIITPNGKEFTTQNGVAYIGFLIVLLFLFIITILGGFKIRWKHLKNENGDIITINDFRYIKVFLFSMAYMELMFLFGLSYKLFNGAGMEGFNNFFYFVYQMFLRLMYPIIILTFVIFIVIFLSNLKLKKNKELGL